MDNEPELASMFGCVGSFVIMSGGSDVRTCFCHEGSEDSHQYA